MTDHSELIAQAEKYIAAAKPNFAADGFIRGLLAVVREQAGELKTAQDAIKHNNVSAHEHRTVLRTANDTLRSEVAALRKDAERADNQRNQARAELRDIAADLRNQRDTLRAALLKYGQHRPFGQGEGTGCRSLYSEMHPHRGPCNCGLADSLAAGSRP